MENFIRFTLLRQDVDSGKSQGMLTAAADLRDDGDISSEEHHKIRVALDWFNAEIPVPKPLKKQQNKRAISWFRSEATEAIRRMWELKQMLNEHGLHVNVHRETDPGIIVYEDQWQVVAIPMRGQKVS